jgi:ribosomal-protein-serine acetyltransferase
MTKIEKSLRVDENRLLVPVSPDLSLPLFAVIDANRVHLREWLPFVDKTQSTDSTREFIESSLRQREAETAYDFALMDDRRVCGMFSLNRIDRANHAGSLGYWLAQDQQYQGIATSACRAVIMFGFSELGLNRLAIAAAVQNSRSRRLAERLGFSYEGTSQEAEWIDHRYVDHARYAMLHREWSALSGA